MRCAVCLFVRDEARDIQEWIAYHKAIGFDACIVYDNGSSDETVEKAMQMSAVADIRIVDFGIHTYSHAQLSCYLDCCARFGGEFDWIAFIDSDEFVTSVIGERIQSLLARNSGAAVIALNWACFGSNGHQDFPQSLCIEAFSRRAEDNFPPNRHVKCIVRPGSLKQPGNPHYFEVDGKTVRSDGRAVEWLSGGVTLDVDISNWRIHHYITRSRAHWALKIARGYRDATRSDDQFAIYDRNIVMDRSAIALAMPVWSMLDAANGR